MLKVAHKNTVVFVSTCLDDWGGSEELWSRSIPFLQPDYQNVFVYKNHHNAQLHVVKKLKEAGVIFKNLSPSSKPFARFFRKVRFIIKRARNRTHYQEPNHYLVESFKKEVVKIKPQLIVISQGINFDGLAFAYHCSILKIPYVIVSHKAVEFFWPPEKDRNWMRKAFQNALSCCFVSSHNLLLTEDQFGIRLNNSRVVFNPIKITRQVIPYPPINDGFRLACIGRFHLIDKGQDILIRVLSQKKWRKRPLTISLIGSGPDLKAIEDMINLYELTNVILVKFQQSIADLWLNYHGLILPSRSEGLPLTITEAMSAGRISIVSNAGGNGEFIEDGITGFIGEANPLALDQALERAWGRRYEWKDLGTNANAFIKENIPPLPEKNFAELLKQLTNETRTISLSNHSYV